MYYLLEPFAFVYLLILNGLKVKNYLRINILIIEILKMVIKSLKIKNQSYYFWSDIIFIDDFDIKFLKIVKRESRIGVDIYYIGYVVNDSNMI